MCVLLPISCSALFTLVFFCLLTPIELCDVGETEEKGLVRFSWAVEQMMEWDCEREKAQVGAYCGVGIDNGAIL